ncbi:hypothetical protein E3N88_46090 [Mikania micrantha]|uniref:Uncharacterized protein n=1 Tax=Mikania micrantha TaxID=192012 RepID=A0A5N6L802_9ASTR|nr:hypothetical protein E3N88_46090 [Mikania micrantha]
MSVPFVQPAFAYASYSLYKNDFIALMAPRLDKADLWEDVEAGLESINPIRRRGKNRSIRLILHKALDLIRMDSFRKKTGKRAFMTIKVDLSSERMLGDQERAANRGFLLTLERDARAPPVAGAEDERDLSAASHSSLFISKNSYSSSNSG